MKARQRMALIFALALPLVSSPLTAAAMEEESGQGASAPPAAGVALYKPPQLGAPRLRIGGGVRGGGGTGAPVVHVLAPQQLGLTVAEQPTLYWYLDQTTPHMVEITLNEAGGVAPVARVELAGPVAAGLHAFSLAAQGKRLTLGQEYEWFVAVVVDQEQRSRDIIAGGGLQRVAPPTDLKERLAGLGAKEAGAAYAGAGLWYDAIAAMADRAGKAPAPTELANQFSAILQQEGISDVRLTPPTD